MWQVSIQHKVVRTLGVACMSLAICIAVEAGEPKGLSKSERALWYDLSQGSRLLPEAWFNALEVAGSEIPFSSTEHLQSFGFLPRQGAKYPIGFVRDRQRDKDFGFSKLRWYTGQGNGEAKKAEAWIGLNCAACHTAQITFKGDNRIIDGGPASTDFDAFVESMDAALEDTQANDLKWQRFAAKVLQGNDNPGNREKLKAALAQMVAWQQRTAQMNKTALRSGPSRLDAFGHIYNKVVMFANPDGASGNPSDAPVSYPFLWYINRHNKVQWNGVAENSKLGNFLRYGAMGRNTGEVIGVFGDVDLQPLPSAASKLKGFKSSVRARNLNWLEKLTERIKSPKWPQQWKALDNARIDRGRTTFVELKCNECHLSVSQVPMGKPVERMLRFADTSIENLTDTAMACNAYLASAPSGVLKGIPLNYLSGSTLGDKSSVVSMLTVSVKGAMVNQKKILANETLNAFLGIEKPPKIDGGDIFESGKSRKQREQELCLKEATSGKQGTEILAYKARPLEGIWATAPYLHNGSVPSLYDLLLPAEKRPKRFLLGSLEFDPDHVGFTQAAQPDNWFTFNVMDENSKPIIGNSNAGHDYGVSGITEEQRLDLLEYLKSL